MTRLASVPDSRLVIEWSVQVAHYTHDGCTLADALWRCREIQPDYLTKLDLATLA